MSYYAWDFKESSSQGKPGQTYSAHAAQYKYKQYNSSKDSDYSKLKQEKPKAIQPKKQVTKSSDRAVALKREKYTEKIELWVCKICKKEYMSKSGLNRHFSNIHEPPKKTPAPKKKIVKNDTNVNVQVVQYVQKHYYN